jgi:hypothetical protein
MATATGGTKVNMANDSLNQGEAMGLAGGAWIAGDQAVCFVMTATVALNPGDAVLVDFANGVRNVTKTASADSVLRFGIAVTAAGVGNDVVIAVMGLAQAIAGAAIAQNANVSTSANAAGQTKTSAAAGGHAQLGIAVTAAAGAASLYLLNLDKA